MMRNTLTNEFIINLDKQRTFNFCNDSFHNQHENFIHFMSLTWTNEKRSSCFHIETRSSRKFASLSLSSSISSFEIRNFRMSSTRFFFFTHWSTFVSMSLFNCRNDISSSKSFDRETWSCVLSVSIDDSSFFSYESSFFFESSFFDFLVSLVIIKFSNAKNFFEFDCSTTIESWLW